MPVVNRSQSPVRLPQGAPETLPQTGKAAIATGSPLKDRLTWISFLIYGVWSLGWGLFSPAMPFLRAELKLGYSVAALHFSAMALGLLIAGISGARILSNVRPAPVIWCGTTAVALATASVILHCNHYCTILAAFIVGFTGSVSAQAIIGSLSERYQEHRTAVIAQLVLVNSLFSTAAPLLVAAVVSLGLPWTLSLASPLVVLSFIAILNRVMPAGTWQKREVSQIASGNLSVTYWRYWSIVFLCVAAEWSITFWCPDYLERVHHFKRAQACAGLSVFLAAMMAGRVVGSVLASRISVDKLIVAATLTAFLGFFLFWRGGDLLCVFAGLIILGLGEANCYPLGLSAALAAAPGKIARATAGISVSTGSAILLAPFILGMAADHVGIMQAYGLVAILLGTAVCTSLYSATLAKAKAAGYSV
jgi:fucose permease